MSQGWLLLVRLRGALIAIAAIGLFLEVAPDLWWGVTHQWTASVFDESFTLPMGWRAVASPAGEHTLELRCEMRALRLFGPPQEISIRQLTGGFDAVEMAQRWERLETRSMIPGDRLEPTPRDTFLREHYRCSDIKRSRDGRITLACFDRDGRWVITLRGRDSGIHDLSAIMQSASPAVPR